MKSPTAPRILTVVAILTMVAAGIGFVVILILNAFVLDEYDVYGEAPIPGTMSLELPAGEVTVTFHAVVVGGSGNGLPVPPLKYRITAPGGADVQLAEDYGSTTTVNNDARVRMGYLHLQTAGIYEINLDGNVSAYVNPTLAFGHGSSYGSLPWIFAAVFGLAVVDLIVARIWAAAARRRNAQVTPTWSGEGYAPPPMRAVPTITPQPQASYTPSDQGVRIEQLNTLVRLRDSGALTEDEYAQEKKRVLDEL